MLELGPVRKMDTLSISHLYPNSTSKNGAIMAAAARPGCAVRSHWLAGSLTTTLDYGKITSIFQIGRLSLANYMMMYPVPTTLHQGW